MHADGRVIRKDHLGRQDKAANGVGQGFQQVRGIADPDGQGGANQIGPPSIKDLAQAIQGKMVSIFVDQHTGKEARSRAAARLTPTGWSGSKPTSTRCDVRTGLFDLMSASSCADAIRKLSRFSLRATNTQAALADAPAHSNHKIRTLLIDASPSPGGLASVKRSPNRDRRQTRS